jgi:hypothetical protein
MSTEVIERPAEVKSNVADLREVPIGELNAQTQIEVGDIVRRLTSETVNVPVARFNSYI